MLFLTSVAVERHRILLRQVAAQVAGQDGLPPGGALLGPRLLFLGALHALPDGRLVALGTAIELLRRATLVHRAPKMETAWDSEGATPLSQTLRGDTLLAESFRLLAADGDPRTVGILSRAMARVSEGELTEAVAPTPPGPPSGRGGAGGHAEDTQHSAPAPLPPGGARGGFRADWRRRAAYCEGAAATGALLGGMDEEAERAYIAWGRSIGEAHEAALSGETALPLPRFPLRFAERDETVTLVEGLLDAIGKADTL